MVTFTSPLLTEAVAITGLITVDLYVASTAADTDLAVKVLDVFPTGESMLVQDGILRMRWHDGCNATEPQAMVPGATYQVTVMVGWMSYVFNPLHAIRVTVAGTNYPRFSVNSQSPNGTVLAPGPLTDGATLVMGDILRPSALNLPVVPLGELLAMRV